MSKLVDAENYLGAVQSRLVQAYEEGRLCVICIDPQFSYFRAPYTQDPVYKGISEFFNKVGARIPSIFVQYSPKYFGRVVVERPEGAPLFTKRDISLMHGAPHAEIPRYIAESECDTFIVCGLSYRSCLAYSAHDLAASGYDVHVLAEGTDAGLYIFPSIVRRTRAMHSSLACNLDPKITALDFVSNELDHLADRLHAPSIDEILSVLQPRFETEPKPEAAPCLGQG